MNREPITQLAGVAKGCAGNEGHQVKAKLMAKITAETAMHTAKWRARTVAQIPFLAFLVFFLGAASGLTQVKTRTVPLDDFNEMQPRNAKTEQVTYKGRKALRVTDAAPTNVADGIQLVILNKTEFQDGVIEIELTGEPSATAGEGARGFVGVAFRVNLDAAKDAAKYECFYLRPTNGRADDQVRRNHSTQYISYPDFPWHRLRKEFPEKYESYVDLVPGEWTKVKIEVRGDKARLYVHDAPQPVLVVNDLKQRQGQGRIALWVGAGTVAHFSNLRVSK
jgi:3-keto-disaccharide hydrolase